jgi:hypothetical protein
MRRRASIRPSSKGLSTRTWAVRITVGCEMLPAARAMFVNVRSPLPIAERTVRPVAEPGNSAAGGPFGRDQRRRDRPVRRTADHLLAALVERPAVRAEGFHQRRVGPDRHEQDRFAAQLAVPRALGSEAPERGDETAGEPSARRTPPSDWPAGAELSPDEKTLARAERARAERARAERARAERAR